MKQGPKADEIRAQLAILSRQPFQDLLARILECAPSNEAIKAQAEKYPDRYGQLMAIVARAGGYTEKTETTHNYNIAVQQMSDAEIYQRLADHGIDPMTLEEKPQAPPTWEKPESPKADSAAD